VISRLNERDKNLVLLEYVNTATWNARGVSRYNVYQELQAELMNRKDGVTVIHRIYQE
jgi:hypothetical protein